MNSVKLQDTINDFNFHIIHAGESPSDRTVNLVRILKARDDSSKFSVTYSMSSDKLQGMEFDEVYIDDISGMGNK